MLNKMWDDIITFHNKFKIPPAELPTLDVAEGLMDFRVEFMQEEMNEFIDAVQIGDRVKAFDALLDLVYVAMGTAYICRFPWVQGWDAVHAANMLKRRVEHHSESKRGSKYDVVKPEGWVAPDRELELILELYEIQIRKSKLKFEEPIP